MGAPDKRSAEEREAERVTRLRKRREALRTHARALEEHLRRTPRLPESDRRALVRNFGRLIERRFPGAERATATRIFRRAHGDVAGISMDKKRKRYIRFDGEPLPAEAPSGEYHAHGATFLGLIAAFVEECGGQPDTEGAWRMLSALCEGTSFATSGRPTVASGEDPRERFRGCITRMLDKLARETDVVGYLAEASRLSIRSHPRTRDDFTPEQLNQLPYRHFLPSRFEHVPPPVPDARSLDGPLVLDGFGTDAPSELLPQMRLARIYWPRHVLCLPISVDTAALTAIDAMRPSLEEAKADRGPDYDHAVGRWREEHKQALLRAAMLENGLDPEKPDWDRFVDPLTNEALEGATWRRFYQAWSYDLVLAADGEPENLQLGIYTAGWWTHRPMALRMPADDVAGASGLNIEYAEWGDIVVFPDGPKSMICRPLAQWAEGGLEEIGFQDLRHPMVAAMEYETFGLETDMAWRLLSMPMMDWTRARPDVGGRLPNDEAFPCLRTCFSAPEGWAPAPEGSLAAAMMCSLAHGAGPERLDDLLAEAINARVTCLSRLQEDLEQRFQSGLRESGYGS